MVPSHNRLPLPIKRLTPAELQERREKGLCFNCNEKFGPGHRCKKLFLIEGSWPEEESDNDEGTEDHECRDMVEMPEISLHAICGAQAPQTMKVEGNMGKHRVVVLVDSGSTHNFVSERLAHKLGLQSKSKGKFEVVVANGEKVASGGKCQGVRVLLQGVPIIVDFYILPLEGYDVVLGAQWLRTLGPILWDFSKMLMIFKLEEKKVELRSMTTPTDKIVDENEFKKELKKRKE